MHINNPHKNMCVYVCILNLSTTIRTEARRLGAKERLAESERRSRQAQVVRYADDGEPVSTEITNENYKTISLEKCQQQIRKR